MTLATALYLVAFGLLVLVVELWRVRKRPVREALTEVMGRAEHVELEAWVPELVPINTGREQRGETMRRFGMTVTILAGLVLWYAYVVPPVRGDDVRGVVSETAEVPVGALLESSAAASERVEVFELEVLDEAVVEDLPLPMPVGEIATSMTLVDETPDEPSPAPATLDPESDATATEVMGAVGMLIQAIKDKDALAITVGAFLVLFAVFRLRPVRDGLGKWISPAWYRVIPVGLAMVLGILVAIAAGGDVVEALVKGLAGGGGIAVIYAVAMKASAKKDEEQS